MYLNLELFHQTAMPRTIFSKGFAKKIQGLPKRGGKRGKETNFSSNQCSICSGKEEFKERKSRTEGEGK